MVEALKHEYEFYILTSDKDIDGTRVSGETDKWIEPQPGHHVQYLTAGNQTKAIYKKLIRELDPDIIYINGIFSRKFSILPLLVSKASHKKIIIAVRGMLYSSALSVKPVKKRFFLSLAKLLGLYKGIIFHVTDQFEEKEVRKEFRKGAIQVAGNIPRKLKPFQELPQHKKQANNLQMIWIGRIAEEKNPLFLLQVLNTLDKPLTLDFYGSSIDKGYEAKFLKKLNSLPSQINIQLKGSCPPEEIDQALKRSDILIACSKGENFGHAVYEALSSGVPVIISENTPWKNLKEKQAGYDLLLDEKEFQKAISHFYEMDPNEYYLYRKGAYQCAMEYWERSGLHEKYRKMLSV
jgi:glycosyltransferase involved in cell wall biosynthesis